MLTVTYHWQLNIILLISGEKYVSESQESVIGIQNCMISYRVNDWPSIQCFYRIEGQYSTYIKLTCMLSCKSLPVTIFYTLSPIHVASWFLLSVVTKSLFFFFFMVSKYHFDYSDIYYYYIS